MEQELKFRLPDRAAYDRLAAALGPESGQHVQVNHYFDTVGLDIARSGRSMLRIREQANERVLTFKLGSSQIEGYFRAEELEATLDPEIADQLKAGQLTPEARQLPPLQRLEEIFGPQECLLPQGSMRNLRRRFPLPSGEEAELDETSFPDGSTDYELEIETEQPDVVRAYLIGLGLTLEPQETTKFGRFLRRR